MSKLKVDDNFLYTHMPEASEYRFEQFPAENELNYKFSRRFERKMKALLKFEKRTPFMRTFINYSKKCVAVVLIFIILAFTVTISVNAYRIKFFEVIATMWEDLTSIIYKGDLPTDHSKLIPIEPYYIPEDFTIYDCKKSEYKLTVVYKNTEDENIYYSQKLITQSENIVDTEGGNYEIIKLGNQNVNVLKNKGAVRVQWVDKYNSYTLISTLSHKELLKMTESIINNQK